jgi:syntaxin 18
MDVSAAFRAAAAAHALERRFGSPDVVERLVASKSLPPPSARSPVLKSAHDALALVRELHLFVSRSRGAYLRETKDADATRDGIEGEVRLSVTACQAHVDMLKATVLALAEKQQDSKQTVAHLHGVVLIITERLAAVANAFDECRTVRFRKVLVEADRRRRRAPASGSCFRVGGTNRGDTNSVDGEQGGTTRMTQQQGQATQTTQQQQQLHLTERDLLSDELAGVADQVRIAEASVVEISALSSLFAKHVHTQAAQIELLYSQAVEATFHLNSGNNELRKTIARRGDAQRLVAYVLFAATVALLFVDWVSG